MKQEDSLKGKKCRVISEYHSAYSDPLKLKVGETVTLRKKKSEWSGWLWCEDRTGEKGWVPESYVERRGNSGKMLMEYDATELTVEKEEELEIIKEESGWLWCKNRKGDFGWIPKENVTIR